MKILDYFEEGCIVILLAFMSIMNFINVVARMFRQSFSFTEEITVIAFVWVTMFGIASAYKYSAHMGMSFLTDKMSQKNQAKMVLFSTICSCAFALLLFYYGCLTVYHESLLHAVTPSLGVPLESESLSIPVGAVLILIRSLQSGLRTYLSLQQHGKEAA